MRPASSSGTGSPSLGCVPPWSARCGKRWRWPVPRSTEEMKSPVSATTSRPIAIYYEHPDWFRPLFQELDRRGVPYVRIDAAAHRFDAGDGRPPYSLVFNRMSPSAYLRGHGNAIFYTLHYLAYLKRHDVRVINGYDAYVTETSKALQLSLLHHLGLPYPRARVINHPARAPEAAQGFRFPVIVKPNIGGSGAGIRRFETPQQLEQAAGAGALDLGIDQTALVQEYIPAAEQRIVRVEVLGGRYLYAIRIYTPGDSFNLCPGCRSGSRTDRDRKSTRLNSSHRTISYAVFCLKKKRNNCY